MLRIMQLATAALFFLAADVLSAQDENPPARTAYENGLEALGDNLPELAIRRFREALTLLDAEDPLRRTVDLRLGEAMVRAGQTEGALTLLGRYPDDPTAATWSGYAHLLSGRLSAAEAAFADISSPDDEALAESLLLARARILAGLGAEAPLSKVLDELSKSERPAIMAETGLIKAADHLANQRYADARDTLTTITPDNPSQESLHQFLGGLVDLALDDPESAAGKFRTLLDTPRAGNLPLQQAITLAYADALQASGNSSGAIDFLIDHLNRHPTAPNAETCLERLTEWSRSTDALRELTYNRLLEWSKPPTHGFLHQQGDPIATSVAEQSAQNLSPLAPLALLYRARHLAERNDEASVVEALRLLTRLRTETEAPTLVTSSLLDTARLHLATQNREAAYSALRALELYTDSPEMRTRAAELAGVIRYESDDFSGAAKAFARVQEYLGDEVSDSDQLNLGLSLLLSDASEEFGTLLASLDRSELRRSLELEQILLAASRLDPEARADLDRFLRENPGHPRTAEARLALAELCVQFEPRDPSMAGAQLDSIDPAHLPQPLALRHLLSSLQLSQLTGEWEAAVASGNSYLATFPESPLNAIVRLKIGEAYFLNGDFNRAQRLFQQLAADEAATSYHEAALFFAARSALRVLTPESRKEAIALLEEVVAANGPLAGDARLQLARAQLDSGRSAEALDTLAPLINPGRSMPERLDPLVLQAEAFRTLGTSEGDRKAVAILEECLAWEELPYAASNRLHYLKALTLEQLGREKDALDTLYQVVNRENLTDGAAAEWTYFFNCGFKAVRLLGESKDWKGAYAVARKLAASKGPRSEEAAKRARAIQLEHMIWDPK